MKKRFYSLLALLLISTFVMGSTVLAATSGSFTLTGSSTNLAQDSCNWTSSANYVRVYCKNNTTSTTTYRVYVNGVSYYSQSASANQGATFVVGLNGESDIIVTATTNNGIQVNSSVSYKEFEYDPS